MSAVDLLAALEPPRPVTCGECVHRNGPTDLEDAGCAVMMTHRNRDAEPCSYWFGRDQLRAPAYGRKT